MVKNFIKDSYGTGDNFRGKTDVTGTVTFQVPQGVYKYAVRAGGYVC